MTQTNGTNTPGAICAEEYTVKRGDSFYLISHKLGVPLRDLLAANRNIHPARLMVGDVLCIPREEDDRVTDESQTPATDMTTGTEQPPVNTGGITSGTTNGTTNGTTGGTTGGTTNGTTNGTTDDCPPNMLPGCPLDDQLIIQRGQSVADVQILNNVSRHTLDVSNPNVNLETLRVGQTICVPRQNVPCTVPTVYTLLSTDTLDNVAVRLSLPVASLLRANPCLAPGDFTPGTTIVIPSA